MVVTFVFSTRVSSDLHIVFLVPFLTVTDVFFLGFILFRVVLSNIITTKPKSYETKTPSSHLHLWKGKALDEVCCQFIFYWKKFGIGFIQRANYRLLILLLCLNELRRQRSSIGRDI